MPSEALEVAPEIEQNVVAALGHWLKLAPSLFGITEIDTPRLVPCQRCVPHVDGTRCDR